MSAVTIMQMADRVASLLEQRMGFQGEDLGEKLHRKGRKLPRRLRAAAWRLSLLSVMAQNPRLQVHVDEGEVAQNYDICLRYLSPRLELVRYGRMTSITTEIGYGLVMAAIPLALVLHWQGLI